MKLREGNEEEDIDLEYWKERLAFAAAKALAIEAYKYNIEEALEALRRLWRKGALKDEYIEKIPELKELVRQGKLV